MSAGHAPHLGPIPSPPADEVWQSFLLGKLPPEQHNELVAAVERGQVELGTGDGGDDSTDSLVAALRAPSPSSLPAVPPERVERAIARVLEQLPASSPSVAQPVPLEPGLPFERLREYRLLRPLGHGGMGAVYLAEHLRLGRSCAIKLLPATLAANADAVRRFEREMRAVGQFDHPHIVRATDAGECDGRLFLVMEFVDGCNLHQVVRDEGPLSARQALQYVRDAAVGLAFAHQHGVIHRDIKPGNLMRDRAGRVKVLDLGLARFRGVEEAASASDQAQRLTHAGAVMGTIDYMAPEQAADTQDADERSDIYSLGCTLFYLLTGSAPYPQGTIVQRIVAHRDAPIPQLAEFRRDLPTALDELLSTWLAKRPADRPRSMAVAIEQLDALLQSVDLPAGTPLMVVPRVHVTPDASVSTATHIPLTAPVVLPKEFPFNSLKPAHPLWVGIGLAVLIVVGVLACLQFLLRDEEPWGRGMTASSGDLNMAAGTIPPPSVPKPTPKARPLNFNAQGRLDLLRWIDLTSDVDKGILRFQGRALHVGSNARLSVRATGPLPPRTRLVLELSRVPETDGALRLVFQHQQTVFGLILDAPSEVPGHRTCGINPYPRDGLFRQLDVARSEPMIPVERPVVLQIDLLENGLRVTTEDDVPLYEWTGDFSTLTGKLAPPDFPTLLLDTWADAEQFLIRRAELIDLDQVPAVSPAAGATP